MRLTLRVKLALISLLLLTIPFAGIRVSENIKQELLTSREDTLLFSARAVSSALSGRSGLFDKELFHSQNINSDLYLHHLKNHIRLNGKADDWQSDIKEARTFGEDHVVFTSEVYNPNSLSFQHLSGVRGDYLYTIFLVKDETVVYRNPQSLRLDKSDYLQIGIEDQAGKKHQYLLTAIEPGWVNGFKIPSSAKKSNQPIREKRIQGAWSETTDGYIIEIRLPMTMVGPKLAFAIGDIDDANTRSKKYIISTTTLDNEQNFGWVVSPSTTIDDILGSLNRPHSRILIVDGNRRLRASHGKLSGDAPIVEPESSFLNQVRKISYRLFSPIYKFFTTSVATNVEQPAKQLSTLDLEGIKDALQGSATVTHYRIGQDLDQGVDVMAAITPLYKKDAIVGAVVVEQTTNSILALQNMVIEEFITLTIMLFCVAGFGLILFAFRLSSRIRRLGKQAAAALDESGQVHSTITNISAGDEIGDLARSLSSMLEQLQIQTQFKEKMADNLEHEIRTPLAGISASLKNLAIELDTPPPHIQEYLDWALEDVIRLEALLSTIRDATNLSQALIHDQREEFELNKAVEMWLNHSWQPAFPDVDFRYEGPEQSIPFSGDPGRLHQMLDKIIENAVSFHTQNTPIQIALTSATEHHIQIVVENKGPVIPDELKSQIFNSMVSSRKQNDNQPHLGLGLYIAREIASQYKGSIKAESNSDSSGTRFIISLSSSDI
ncbi:MAG: two-component system sensor histidine kinase ChvG [Desulforhopalus sp.]|jgi:two-component system sensor histidine kinase ChvG